MKKFLLFFITATIGCGKIACAQPLYPGDAVPDTIIRGFFGKDTSISLSSLRGKAIIFDFWGHGCRSCIESFPKMEELQERFRDSLVIIAINRESADSTSRFFKRFKKIKVPNLLMIAGDTFIHNLFEKNYIPWHAWIDRYGIVRYVTGGWNATEENVRAFIAGRDPLIGNSEIVNDYNYNVPVIAQHDSKYSNKAIMFSNIASYIPNLVGFGSYYLFDSIKKTVRISEQFSATIDLFITAFSEGGRYNFLPKHTTELQLSSPDGFFHVMDPGRWDEWDKKYSFGYQARFPATDFYDGYRFMQQDLRRFFHIEAEVVIKEIPVWSLVKREDCKWEPLADCRSNSDNVETYNYRMVELDRMIRSWNEVLNPLSYKLTDSVNQSLLVINRTGYSGLVNLTFRKDVIEHPDFNSMNEELRKHCLEFKVEVLPVPVLVFKNL